jgi:uncharacterized membrane protein
MAEGADGGRADHGQHHLRAAEPVSAERSSLDRLETHLGRLLVTGVVISAAFLATGLGWWLFDPQNAAALWLLNAGLMVLMATPMLRVAVSFAEYINMRQWFFAAVTVVVLVELSVTVLVALSRRH